MQQTDRELPVALFLPRSGGVSRPRWGDGSWARPMVLFELWAQAWSRVPGALPRGTSDNPSGGGRPSFAELGAPQGSPHSPVMDVTLPMSDAGHVLILLAPDRKGD
jgi:hypothetical protein